MNSTDENSGRCHLASQQAQLDEERRTELPLPERAAWCCGRLVNEIEHRTQVLWFLGGESEDCNEDEETGETTEHTLSGIPWTGLRLRVREVVDDEHRRGHLESRVAAAERQWSAQFGRLWHHELLHAFNPQVNDDFVNQQDGSLAEILNRRFALILDSVTEINHDLKLVIEAAMSSRQLGIYRAAALLDQLIHPVPAYRVMTVNQGFQQPVECGWESSFPNSAIEDRLARLPIVLPSVEAELGDEWSQRLAQLDVASIDLTAFDDAATYSKRRTVITELESAFHARICSPVEAGEQTTQTVSVVADCSEASTVVVSPVGLGFDEGRQLVRHEATGHWEEVDNRMTFNVLRSIAMRGSRFTTGCDLMEDWQTFGGRSDGETAVDSRMNKVRSVVSQLGMSVENRRGVGWRIIPQPSGQASCLGG